jgi:REP element-mobilizing transposase RayT
LEQAREKHKAKVYAYALMDNHIHILVKCESINLLISSMMISYVRWYNKKHKLSDRLCQSPYNSAVKDSYKKIRNSITYILQNPIKEKMCINPADYRWSSYQFYFNNKYQNYKNLKGKKSSCMSKIEFQVVVETSMVEEMFGTKTELDNSLMINSKPVTEKEIFEKEDNWKKISHSELCIEFIKILDGRVLADLSKNEMRVIAKILMTETSAIYGQIASLLHVTYEFVRRLKYKNIV